MRFARDTASFGAEQQANIDSAISKWHPDHLSVFELQLLSEVREEIEELVRSARPQTAARATSLMAHVAESAIALEQMRAVDAPPGAMVMHSQRHGTIVVPMSLRVARHGPLRRAVDAVMQTVHLLARRLCATRRSFPLRRETSHVNPSSERTN